MNTKEETVVITDDNDTETTIRSTDETTTCGVDPGGHGVRILHISHHKGIIFGYRIFNLSAENDIIHQNIKTYKGVIPYLRTLKDLPPSLNERTRLYGFPMYGMDYSSYIYVLGKKISVDKRDHYLFEPYPELQKYVILVGNNYLNGGGLVYHCHKKILCSFEGDCGEVDLKDIIDLMNRIKK